MLNDEVFNWLINRELNRINQHYVAHFMGMIVILLSVNILSCLEQFCFR